jgi:hypothetical protein
MSQNKKLLRRRKEHREIFELMIEADVIVQVLDARFPQKCRSTVIESFAKKKSKQIICCINKTDLIPQEIAEKWKQIISRELPTVFISATDRQGTSFLRKQIARFSPEGDVKVCIVGYPNVGKSSLINVLKGKKSAPTSPTAGYTRHLRTVRITSSLQLIDTPGISPRDSLSVEEEVFLGTISPEDITNPDMVCSYIFSKFTEESMHEELEKYLGCALTESTEDILIKFATRRGMLRKNAEPQTDEAARIIIRDFMSGKIRYYEKPKNKQQLEVEKT